MIAVSLRLEPTDPLIIADSLSLPVSMSQYVAMRAGADGSLSDQSQATTELLSMYMQGRAS